MESLKTVRVRAIITSMHVPAFGRRKALRVHANTITTTCLVLGKAISTIHRVTPNLMEPRRPVLPPLKPTEHTVLPTPELHPIPILNNSAYPHSFTNDARDTHLLTSTPVSSTNPDHTRKQIQERSSCTPRSTAPPPPQTSPSFTYTV
ncbi:hypothetical protein PTTG_27321, partial [Puccinia triticina 1-1 BBBD Race 1]